VTSRRRKSRARRRRYYRLAKRWRAHCLESYNETCRGSDALHKELVRLAELKDAPPPSPPDKAGRQKHRESILQQPVPRSFLKALDDPHWGAFLRLRTGETFTFSKPVFVEEFGALSVLEVIKE